MNDIGDNLPSLRKLLQEIQATQQRIVDESVKLTTQLQSFMQQVELLAWSDRNIVPVQYPYEFFRGRNGWNLRFDNKMVGVGRNDKGLLYIYKMLMYPKRKFYPNELDPTSSDAHHSTLISVSETLFIESDVKYQQMNPGDENAYLRALEDLWQHKPDELDSPEKHIYFYSQMCYLADSLKNIRALAKYITLYKEAKSNLDDLVFDFEQSCDDKLFVERVLKQSGQIRATARDESNTTKKMRERVVKNIQNAIKSIESEVVRDYFTKHIHVGIQSYYTPDPIHPISWHLETDE